MNMKHKVVLKRLWMDGQGNNPIVTWTFYVDE
jgi:hypothetical protein